MKKHVLTSLFLVLVITTAVFSKDKKAPVATSEELAAITDRGRALYEYERSVWQANEALTSINTPRNSSAKFIAQKTSDGWVVTFGQLSEGKDTFNILYEITQIGANGKVSIKGFKQRTDAGYFRTAAMAIETALADFSGEKSRPFTAAVLPADAGQLYVYVYPSATKKGVLPLGGDVRYLVAADGKTIAAKRLLHKTILETTTASPGQTVAGVHSHVLTDVPEDTDVLHVLKRGLPEFVGCGGRVYRVEADGKITAMKS